MRAIVARTDQAHTQPFILIGNRAMRGRAVVLAAALVMAPLGAQAADLVVW